MNMDKVLYAKDYIPAIATTRAVAQELFSQAKKHQARAISLKNIDIASRSFTHELLTLSETSNLDIIDCNQDIKRLIEIIHSNKPVKQFEFRRAEPLKI